MNTDMEKVPIPQKLTLTIREAAEYSNIGINKIDSLLRSPNCPFVLFVGAKKLVTMKGSGWMFTSVGITSKHTTLGAWEASTWQSTI